MKYRHPSIAGFLLALTLLFSLSHMSNCNAEVLTPSGTVGERQLDLIKWSFLVMLGVFALVVSLFTYVLVRYRKRRNRDIMPIQVHGNTKLEIIWTVIPFILLAFLAFPTIKTTFFLDQVADKSRALPINVVGHQYWWEFEYPTLGIKTAQELHIPVGQQIDFKIEGRDVLHSFWIPALGGKMDVVPGLTNHLWLDAKRPGMYQGKCAELCGAGHALMDFKVFAESKDSFDSWVSRMTAPPRGSRTASIRKGEELFKQNCMGCHANPNAPIPGPNLDKVATRQTIGGILPNEREHLKQWIKDSPKLKPGSRMPQINYFEKTEMEALLDYLEGRK